MQRIKAVGIISLAKIMAVIYAFFGLLTGIYINLSRFAGIAPTEEATQIQSVGALAVVVFPVIYALLGGLSGLASGFFFNLAVKWVGPLEVGIFQALEPAPAPGEEQQSQT
jgi:hypothetical protein